ncbi:NAD(P)-dependent oxidoreductase [Candidatus Pelagibacter sp.]|nr:NAD(P)-dependent oxidoreductase [Candidatus Pelagibacter sp.]
MKRILITGGAGFIGYHLTRKLVDLNYKIFLIDNLSRGKKDKFLKKLLKNKNVKLLRHDLNKKLKYTNNFDYIFHLAAVVGVQNVKINPISTLRNNILPLFNIIEFTKNSKTKIIFFSTSEVYSPMIKKKIIKFPLSENNEIILPLSTSNRDTYFISKIFCEKILQSSKINYLILRPHNIYGPRMGYSHVIPELIEKFNKKKIVNLFSPSHTRAFCYIDDAIHQIIELSFKKNTNNRIFNIGNQKEEIKIYNLGKKISILLKSKKKIIKRKDTLGSPYRRVPNMKKTLSYINYKSFTDLDSGLKKTINWYKNEKD